MIDLFAPSVPTSKVLTVVRQGQAGFWVTTDSAGRLAVVASSETWKRGDSVAVIGDRIVGRAGKTLPPAVYEV